jgi:hypothetical protein
LVEEAAFVSVYFVFSPALATAAELDVASHGLDVVFNSLDVVFNGWNVAFN